MTLVVFRVDSTDLFKSGRPIDDQPRMMRLQAMMMRPSDWTVVGQFDTLIKPEGWKANAGAAATHGISERQCVLYGVRHTAALAMFFDFVRAATEIAAWGLPFHAGIVDIELARLKANPPEWKGGGIKRTCIMQIASDRWSSGRSMKIENAWKRAAPGDGFDDVPMPDKMTASIHIMKVIRNG